jgi:sugar lactone lactonase YvrE
MKTPSPSLPGLFASKALTGKLFLLAFLICFCNDLFAGVKPVYKDVPVAKADNTRNKARYIIKGTQYAQAIGTKKSNALALPTISYSGPQTYIPGIAITPLRPTSSGVAAPGYSITVLGSSIHGPDGVAVDGAGNVFVAVYWNNAVEKIPVGGGAPVTLGSGFFGPLGVAVDAAGNVYVADTNHNAVKMIPVGGGAPVTLGSGFYDPCGVAVDAAGNVYVADFGNKAVKKIPVGGGAPVTLGSGFSYPEGVAVDAAGNVYVGDPGNNTVKEIPVGGGAPVTLGSRFNNPTGVAVDAAGNVYVADRLNNAVKKIPVGGGAPVTLGSGFYYPTGVAVDNADNVYVGDEGNNAVKEVKPVGGYYINKALPKGLSLDENTGIISGTPTGTSPATNYTITAYNSSGSASATVNIKVAPSPIDANLAGLAISRGPLTPAFAAGTTNYTATVLSAVSSITVTPTTNDARATVKVNGTTVASGSASASLPLSYGDNLITVLVTSPDGTAVKTYKITVNRIPPPTISYSGPQTYNVGTAITPLVPTSSGVAAPGYSNNPVTLGSGFFSPNGVAVDAAGNVYVSSDGNNTVKKIPVAGGAPVVLGSGFLYPHGVAVDAAGNVYVADYGDNAVKKIPVGGGVPVTVGHGFYQPVGVAVDAAGNVYVADAGNDAVEKLLVGGGGTL